MIPCRELLRPTISYSEAAYRHLQRADVLTVLIRFHDALNALLSIRDDLIRLLLDQNPCAQSLRPIDIMRQGWRSSLRHASQQWPTMSS